MLRRVIFTINVVLGIFVVVVLIQLLMIRPRADSTADITTDSGNARVTQIAAQDAAELAEPAKPTEPAGPAATVTAGRRVWLPGSETVSGKTRQTTAAQACQTTAAQTDAPQPVSAGRATERPSTAAARPTADAQSAAAEASQETAASDPTAAPTTVTTDAVPTTTAIATTTAAATTVAPTTAPPSATTAPAAKANADAPLGGITICIDPGHQGKQNSDLEPVAPGSSEKKAKVSSGTAGVTTREPEYKLTLAVSLKLKALLEAAGAKVVMTRESNDVDISNAERAQLGNDAGADLAIRIHADGSENRDVNGISMQIPSPGSVGETLAAAGRNAGSVVLENVIAATGAKNRGLVERGDLTGFNWSTVPSILIEMGFMSNPDEDRLLATEDYRDKIANGLRDGVVAYFE